MKISLSSVPINNNVPYVREMQRKQGLEEAEIQKLHTTAPEHLTDDKLLLSTLCAEGLDRKHSVVGTMIALVSHQKPLTIYQNCQSARAKSHVRVIR